MLDVEFDVSYRSWVCSEYNGTKLKKNSITNCLTVDVEDYFQVSAFADRVSRKDWDKYECRVEANTDRLLAIFYEAEVLGTFFVLGWVAERYPGLVRRIAAAGHEIASHGYWHQLVYDLSPEEFDQDIRDSKDAIHNACGIEVAAYRAPSFSIVPRSRWALGVLAKNGFTVDSSIFPIAGHDRYGDPDAPKAIHTIETDYGPIIEFPPTAGRINLGIKRFPLPIGGGYFRLFPLRLTQFAINQVNMGMLCFTRILGNSIPINLALLECHEKADSGTTLDFLTLRTD